MSEMNKCPRHLIEAIVRDSSLLRLTCRKPEEHKSVEELINIADKVHDIFSARENFDIEW